METDETLINETSKKNELAFEELVKRYENQIVNLIYKYVNNTADAEELAQEVFLKVWKYANNFKGKSKFSTWLYRIAVNTCLNFKKHKVSVFEFFDEKIQSAENNYLDSFKPDTLLEKNNSDIIVRNLIDNLPSNQKIALILSRFEGKSYKEIADIMEISVSSVESILFRAKQNLQQNLLPLKENNEI